MAARPLGEWRTAPTVPNSSGPPASVGVSGGPPVTVSLGPQNASAAVRRVAPPPPLPSPATRAAAAVSAPGAAVSAPGAAVPRGRPPAVVRRGAPRSRAFAASAAASSRRRAAAGKTPPAALDVSEAAGRSPVRSVSGHSPRTPYAEAVQPMGGWFPDTPDATAGRPVRAASAPHSSPPSQIAGRARASRAAVLGGDAGRAGGTLMHQTGRSAAEGPPRQRSPTTHASSSRGKAVMVHLTVAIDAISASAVLTTLKKDRRDDAFVSRVVERLHGAGLGVSHLLPLDVSVQVKVDDVVQVALLKVATAAACLSHSDWSLRNAAGVRIPSCKTIAQAGVESGSRLRLVPHLSHVVKRILPDVSTTHSGKDLLAALLDTSSSGSLDDVVESSIGGIAGGVGGKSPKSVPSVTGSREGSGLKRVDTVTEEDFHVHQLHDHNLDLHLGPVEELPSPATSLHRRRSGSSATSGSRDTAVSTSTRGTPKYSYAGSASNFDMFARFHRPPSMSRIGTMDSTVGDIMERTVSIEQMVKTEGGGMRNVIAEDLLLPLPDAHLTSTGDTAYEWIHCSVTKDKTGAFYMSSTKSEQFLMSAKKVAGSTKAGSRFFLSQYEHFPDHFVDGTPLLRQELGGRYVAVLERDADITSHPYTLKLTSCQHCDVKLGKYMCRHRGDGDQLRQVLFVLYQQNRPMRPRGLPEDERVMLHDVKLVLPRVYSGAARAVWCPRNPRGGDTHARSLARSEIVTSMAGSAGDGSNSGAIVAARTARDDELELRTEPPRWSAERKALTMVFECGRIMTSSSKNMLLSVQLPDGSKCPVLEFGKMEHGKFALSFRYPIAPVQAFGAFLSAFGWYPTDSD